MERFSLTLAEVRTLALDALKAQGFSDAQADAIADTVTNAERDACQAHGLFRIPFYVKALGNKRVDSKALPAVTRLAPAIVKVDGKFGFAPLALKCGIAPLIEAAQAQGIAALCVNNVYHIASLWPEVEAIAEADLVGFAYTNALPMVAPAGGRTRLFGTNPMAFAWPRKGRPPLVFDQASSVVARGEVMIHQRDGKPIPEGWAIGPNGAPTTDPTVALSGALLPFGGHKGSSIALMIELLSGALVGDSFSHEIAERDPGMTAPCGGEFLIAISPALCAGLEVRDRQNEQAEGLFARILEQDGARLPSDRRYAARARTPTEGITIPASLFETLQSYAAAGK